ncbi:MAG: hypothetical protein KHX36_10830, partial [Clostridiales bacterium]|nr:hypothetical protein [Clostridiales bacterium]
MARTTEPLRNMDAYASVLNSIGKNTTSLEFTARALENEMASMLISGKMQVSASMTTNTATTNRNMRSPNESFTLLAAACFIGFTPPIL